jgi:hypothetical protein
MRIQSAILAPPFRRRHLFSLPVRVGVGVRVGEAVALGVTPIGVTVTVELGTGVTVTGAAGISMQLVRVARHARIYRIAAAIVTHLTMRSMVSMVIGHLRGLRPEWIDWSPSIAQPARAKINRHVAPTRVAKLPVEKA